MTSVYINKLWSNIKLLAAGLFEAELPKNRRWLAAAWLLAIYLTGLFWYYVFFQQGTISLEYADWAKITAPRLQFLRTALKEGQLPLHISDPGTFQNDTTRYLAVADTLVSPQLVLLYWLPVVQFVMVDVWLLYTLGFLGLLVLRRRFRLSLVPFTALVLLFNFNGNILAHYAVGHASWGGYFLFPWYAWLVFRLLDGDRSWTWTLGMAGVMFAIWLQGSFHQFVWLLMLLGLIGVLVPRTFWTALRTGGFILLGSAFRILPAIVVWDSGYVGGFDNGFPTLSALWEYLVTMVNPLESKHYYMGTGPALGAWELTTFIGLPAALLLVYFGIYRGLLARQAPFRPLALPLGVMLLLSTGSFYFLIDSLHLPMLDTERVTSRMISVVLTFGLIFTVERFQRWLDEGGNLRPFYAGVSTLAFAMVGMDLFLNMHVWRLSRTRQYLEWVMFDKNRWYVQNDWSDTAYIWLSAGGLVLSLATFALLGLLARRQRRN